MEISQSYDFYVKHLLKMYQSFSERSLRGPSDFKAKNYIRFTRLYSDMDATNLTAKGSQISLEIWEKLANLPSLLSVQKTEEEMRETLIRGESVTCFVVGGEARVCLPQLLNSVLGKFSLESINAACEDLDISCSRCNAKQLAVLKVAGILPDHATSCGLITKTNAERLCHKLLHQSGTSYSTRNYSSYNSFKVYHDCFGKCKGVFVPDLYNHEDSQCIECCQCKDMFSLAQFVCHSHSAAVTRVCHWGFESSKWRSYLMLARGQDDTGALQEYFEKLKNRFQNKCLVESLKRKHEDDVGASVKRSRDRGSDAPVLSQDSLKAIPPNRATSYLPDKLNMHRTGPVDARVAEARRRIEQLGRLGRGMPDDVTGELLCIFDRQQEHICRLTKENAMLVSHVQQLLATVDEYRGHRDDASVSIPPLVPVSPASPGCHQNC